MLLTLPLIILSWISVQLDVGGFSHAHIGHVVFVDVANDPYRGQIRNRKWVRRRVGLHARCVRHFLIGDHARDGRNDVHDAVGLVGIVAQEPKMLGRGIERGLGVVFVVLRDLEILLRHGAVFVQVLGSIQLLSREEFVGDGFAIGVEALPPRHRCARATALGLFARCRQAARGYPQRGPRPA